MGRCMMKLSYLLKSRNTRLEAVASAAGCWGNHLEQSLPSDIKKCRNSRTSSHELPFCEVISEICCLQRCVSRLQGTDM